MAVRISAFQTRGIAVVDLKRRRCGERASDGSPQHSFGKLKLGHALKVFVTDQPTELGVRDANTSKKRIGVEYFLSFFPARKVESILNMVEP